MTFLILFVSAGFNALGSFFLKLLGQQAVPLFALGTLSNPNLYLGVGFLALNMVGYTVFLQRVQLSVGYPAYVGVTFSLVLLLSLFFLRETLGWSQALGIGLILSGMLLAVR